MFRRQFSVPLGAHVLVVDDDQAIRETVGLVLEDAGYRVVAAADGLAALLYLRHTVWPHVVLLDLMMPRMDGTALLRAVAEDPELARSHAYVLLSANLRIYAPTLLRLLSQLHVSVLSKPFDIDALLAQVERAARRLPTDRLADDLAAPPVDCPTLT